MIKFKKGQRVWWNDPAGETSGYYTILSDIEKEVAALAKDGPFEEEIMADYPICISDQYSEATVYAHELEPEYDGNYNDLHMRLRKVREDMAAFIIQKLRENGGVIKYDYTTGSEEGDDIELPATTPLYSKERFRSIVITELRLVETQTCTAVYADGINTITNGVETDFYITPDNHQDVFWFIQIALDY